MDCLNRGDLLEAFQAVHWALLIPYCLAFFLGITLGVLVTPIIARFFFHKQLALKLREKEGNDA